MKIFRKTKNYFKVKPNLTNYQKAYNSFLWKQALPQLSFFPDGKFNAAYNAVDRHLQSGVAQKIALFWEDENGKTEQFTFAQIAYRSNQFANYLKKIGIKKADRVFLFLPRIPELYTAFLGILKIGAIAGTMFSAFKEQGVYDRLENSGAKVVITNRELRSRVEKIKPRLPKLKKIVIVDEVEFQEQLVRMPTVTKFAHLDPREPAFMLYTSGTTGKPKGVVHRHLSLLQQYQTAKWVLDLKDNDVYWCTADPGWITGIAYEILGNWAAGITTVVYDGKFAPEQWYRILQKYKVTVWYTAPTAIRMLMANGENLVKKYNLKSLRHLCSVGEPLNPEAIKWGLKVFSLPFHDNWFQTETGAIMIANFPALDIRLGSMGKPVPGIEASIINEKGKEVRAGVEGDLVIKPGWPAMMIKIWKRPNKYKSYFLSAGRQVKKGPWYLSGDRAYKDKDGYFWFVGRSDDVIKTSGERVGPFEVESSLVEYPGVIETGVIGKPDPLRGEIIKAFVVLNQNKKLKIKNKKYEDELKIELSSHVKAHLAGHAYPREIEFVDSLPKTRSGKIMRRLLKAKELGLPVGDLSTLEEY